MIDRAALAAATAALLATGCLQSSTLVNLRADGSGTIEQTTIMSAAALAELKQFAGAFGGTAAGGVDPFSEEQARAAAARLGEGVAFVSSEPLRSDAGEGRRTVYAFKDIDTLALGEQSGASGVTDLGGGGGGRAREHLAFHLTRQPNGNAVLHVHLPEPKGPSGASAHGEPGGTDPMPVAGRLAMMKQMLRGLKISMAVKPAGTLVRTNSPYVDNGTVTLLEVDFDQLLESPPAMAKLSRVKTLEDAAEALEGVKGVKGLKASPTRDVEIEFAPAK